jgi:hypothetical protein
MGSIGVIDVEGIEVLVCKNSNSCISFLVDHIYSDIGELNYGVSW